ncbi:hypothetical protein COCON_G00056450 [Conger conger]|uniref:J domain-containing protein n=1 Tax=Conger conger TaxID=82655 RepID=A0A9Q1I633_CONCO|nr:hypothetical protein COCON_G00056450 [Conger conger]
MALGLYGGAVVRCALRAVLTPPRGPSAVRQLSHTPKGRGLRESYRLLQLPEAPPLSRAQVQEAYLRLAKLYHPDSGTPTANPALFSQLQDAYRNVLAHLAVQEKEEEEEEEEELRGQMAQHRQYLSYEGVALGPPSQRERVYRQRRADRAAERVLQHRLREQERAAAAAEGAVAAPEGGRGRGRPARITQAVERLVEDLIQESMARGDFQNLSGAGKPLAKFDYNPYADPATHNLNRILMDNGYQPQWIAAQKDIHATSERLRQGLLGCRAGFGEPPTPSEQARWDEHCRAFAQNLARLNKMVDDFNLIVPLLSKQMLHYSLERELSRALRTDRERREREREREREKMEEKEKMNAGALTE